MCTSAKAEASRIPPKIESAVAKAKNYYSQELLVAEWFLQRFLRKVLVVVKSNKQSNK